MMHTPTEFTRTVFPPVDGRAAQQPVYIQCQIRPGVDRNRDRDYVVPPASLVFVDDLRHTKWNETATSVTETDSAPMAVFSNWNGYMAKNATDDERRKFAREYGGRFIGVAVDGTLDHKAVKSTPTACGRIGVAISGAVTIHVDPEAIKTAEVGDYLMWQPEPTKCSFDGAVDNWKPANVVPYRTNVAGFGARPDGSLVDMRHDEQLALLRSARNTFLKAVMPSDAVAAAIAGTDDGKHALYVNEEVFLSDYTKHGTPGWLDRFAHKDGGVPVKNATAMGGLFAVTKGLKFAKHTRDDGVGLLEESAAKSYDELNAERTFRTSVDAGSFGTQWTTAMGSNGYWMMHSTGNENRDRVFARLMSKNPDSTIGEAYVLLVNPNHM